MGQYEYLTRDPWYVAASAPKATHDNTIYFDVRYTLPGGAPACQVARANIQAAGNTSVTEL